MASYPYVLTTGRLKEFLAKLHKIGKPDKINYQFLKSLGFTSSNDRRIVGVLRFIDLIDDNGVPTAKYQAFRDAKKGPTMLASYLREAYRDLFTMYRDAHRKDDEALRTFFRANTDLGDQAVGLIARTFQVLCESADFEKEIPAEKPIVTTGSSITPPGASPDAEQPAITVNVNIQLDLPADPRVYDELFAALAKHLPEMRKR